MAELATLARPYANAVFDVARSDADLDRWSQMLAMLAAAVEAPTVQRLLVSPEVEETEKARKLVEVCQDDLTDRGRRVVQVLAANKRLELLPEIRTQFEALRAEEQATLDVMITSAFPLTDDQQERLAEALVRRFNKEINMTSQVDSALIGGAIIRAGDTVIDGSVRGRLTKLAENINRV
jgi:F-type H+-transporting ATPase subunit delta